MAASNCPSSKDTVSALLSREVRFDNVQSQRHRQKRKQSSSTLTPRGSQNTPPGSSPKTVTSPCSAVAATAPLASSFALESVSEISEEHRNLASEWMHEVVIDSAVKLDVFLLSVTIMDSFLDVCPILTNQVQLLASACLLLADKVRSREDQICSIKTLSEEEIIDYTDNTITFDELKAWEMLVLSKLDWDVNFVIALDYLEPLSSLLSSTSSSDLPSASSDLPPAKPIQTCATETEETNELKNLICSLSKRYATFRAIYSARIVACSALNLVEKNQNPKILQLLDIATAENQVLLRKCSKEFHNVPNICKTPPKNSQSSPFKVESTSTPKSSRTPLRDNISTFNIISEVEPVNTTPIRRRLTSLCGSTGEESKENNDSGFGLFMSTGCESKTPSVSSKNSSKQSSPDSGASSGTSPKNNKDVQEIDKLLESTHINNS